MALENNRLNQLTTQLKQQAVLLVSLIVVIWAAEIIDWLIFGGGLDIFGIQPRTILGLRGILFAPFLHGNFTHLIANTVPFLVLGGVILLRDRRHFWPVTFIVALISGLGTWLIGPRNSVHIGASGIIFGYFGFLLLYGYYRRSLTAVLLSLVIFFFYGGMLWGVLPGTIGISWQGHLFGFIGGGVAARLLGENDQQTAVSDQIIVDP